MLKRDWYEFRKNFFSYLGLWIFIPILINIILAIPLSQLINLEVRYLNWAAVGIWIITSSMAAFLETSNRIRKIKYETNQIDILLHSPTSNVEILLALFFRGTIIGLIQFVFSILITYTLNHEYLGMWNIVLIVFHILSIITFFSVLGIILGLFINSRILIINFYIILFAILSIGMGVFIPINNYPLSYVEFVKNIPLFMVFQNMQSIIVHEDVQWIGLFFNVISSLLLFFISVIASNKIFRKI